MLQKQISISVDALSHGRRLANDVSMSESDAISQDSFDLDAEPHADEYDDEDL